MVLDLTLLYLKEEEFKKHAGVTGQSFLIPVIVFPHLGWISMRFKSLSQYKIFFSFLRQFPRDLIVAVMFSKLVNLSSACEHEFSDLQNS